MATPTHSNPISSRAIPRAAIPPFHHHNVKSPFLLFTKQNPRHSKNLQRYTKNNTTIQISRISRIKAVNGPGGDSYLDMWKKAVDRDRKSVEFERMAVENEEEEQSGEELEKKSSDFEKLLEVSAEERDRVQRMQVIDRAAAAIAAARALLKEKSPVSGDVAAGNGGEDTAEQQEGIQNGNSFTTQSLSSSIGTPGPSFWSWAPPSNEEDTFTNNNEITPAVQKAASPSPSVNNPVLEKERTLDILPIPFETSIVKNGPTLSLPPLQSNMEVEKMEATQETSHLDEQQELKVLFSAHAVEAANALSSKTSEVISRGVNPDGSRFWKETGIERRPDGVVCKWTLTRGVSADEGVEWENKYWEAADEFGYKELGSEKSGRDAVGNVWREYWRESMIQSEGLVQFEKTADKWGKNTQGDEWQEKWWEHYDTTGAAEKWADKWCSIDPNTPLEPGHAHVWHERWGEKYDGQGGSTKYTDKWAERFELDGWSKWGDKWDEHFDPDSRGVKQGESWWEGKYGDRWNRTWGEAHSGSGWVHKYGKSSCGEHWDTHVEQDTWYERYPHYGFFHCFENSVQLREVEKPSLEEPSG